MNNPPKVISLELEEKDVQKDLSAIVNAMSKIRMEAVSDEAVSDERKDEYLHLTYRLASGIEALADEGMLEKLQKIAKTVDRNKQLLNYDPLQDAYWKKHANEFVETLDDVLINVTRDDFQNTDAKHHVLQAIKYLGVKDASFEKKSQVYDTIKPFHGGIVPNEGLAKRILGFLLGKSYSAKAIDELTLKIKNKGANIERLCETAKERGFTKVQLTMPRELVPKTEGAKLLNAAEQNEQKSRGFVNALIKYTTPLSYPILGGLPRSLQEKLEEKYETFDAEKAFYVNNWLENILVFVGGITLSAFMKTDPQYFVTVTPCLVGLAYALPSCLARFGMSSYFHELNNYRYDHSVGSPALKLFFYPIEKLLETNAGKNTASVELTVQTHKDLQIVPNPVPYYEQICKLSTPAEIEKSLSWSVANHNNYGKAFTGYINRLAKAKNSDLKAPSGVPMDITLDRKNQAVIYSHKLDVEKYKKNCSLFCLEGERYIVTTITEEKELDSARTAEILRQKNTLQEKTKTLSEELGAHLIHIKQYENGKLTGDIEGAE